MARTLVATMSRWRLSTTSSYRYACTFASKLNFVRTFESKEQKRDLGLDLDLEDHDELLALTMLHRCSKKTGYLGLEDVLRCTY